MDTGKAAAKIITDFFSSSVDGTILSQNLIYGTADPIVSSYSISQLHRATSGLPEHRHTRPGLPTTSKAQLPTQASSEECHSLFPCRYPSASQHDPFTLRVIEKNPLPSHPATQSLQRLGGLACSLLMEGEATAGRVGGVPERCCGFSVQMHCLHVRGRRGSKPGSEV
jgi:hypothetical protein